MKRSIVTAVVLLLSGCISQSEYQGEGLVPVVSEFEKCVEEGGQVLELTPRQCRDGEGNVYAEKRQPGRVQGATSSGELAASGSGQTCVDACGDRTCQEVECRTSACVCAETAISCPEDCN